MKICAAQTRPIQGDIPGNITSHKMLVERAVSDGAGLIIFPELSLTGYEPTMARKFATHQHDHRFDVFQTISDTGRITIGLGVPLIAEKGICISLLLFQPHKARRAYAKGHLHPDEEPFFVPGRNSPHLQVDHVKLALAICYEISVPEHLEAAMQSGPAIYFASVAKSVKGIDTAIERLSGIARECSVPVLMSNCVGFSDGSHCAGKTSAWNSRGALLGQLNDADEGLVIFDTETQQVIERVI